MQQGTREEESVKGGKEKEEECRKKKMELSKSPRKEEKKMNTPITLWN